MTTEPREEQIKALEELGNELRRVSSSSRTARTSVPDRRAALIGAAAGVLLLVAGSFTPPGRAVASDLASLIGIGDEPSTGGERNAVVIGTGAEHSLDYEVVATGADGAAEGSQGRPTTCLGLEFPRIPDFVSANCLTDETKTSLAESRLSRPLVVGAPEELDPDAELVVDGVAAPDVQTVKIEYVTAAGDRMHSVAELSSLDEGLSHRIGVTDQAKAYVGFLPPGVVGSPDSPRGPLTVANARAALESVEVVAYGSDGAELGRQRPDAGRQGALTLALNPPQARFANRAEIEQQCAAALPRDQPSSEADVQICALEALQGAP